MVWLTTGVGSWLATGGGVNTGGVMTGGASAPGTRWSRSAAPRRPPRRRRRRTSRSTLRGAPRWSFPPMHGVTKPLAAPPGVMVRTSVSPPRLTNSVLRPGLPVISKQPLSATWQLLNLRARHVELHHDIASLARQLPEAFAFGAEDKGQGLRKRNTADIGIGLAVEANQQ